MKWACEWHSAEAAEIIAATPEKGKVMLCRKCHCVTFHARIADKEIDK